MALNSISPEVLEKVYEAAWRRAKERISSDNSSYLAPNLHPWQIAPFSDQSLVLLLTGSKGGGKSWLAAHMLHKYLTVNPGSMGLMVRKTRESMNNSTVLFYARAIASESKDITHKSSMHRFEYANGSVLAYGGMKDEEQREQVRSIGQEGAVDVIWAEEANRFVLNDYQELIGLLRGTSGPYRQIILTTNPDSPTHWINTRLIIGGEAKVYYSGAQDNPSNPVEYLQTLQMMTGIQRQRLVEGKWVQAEGVIYDNFDMERNVVPMEVNLAMPLLWGVDDGYVRGDGPGNANYHPRVVLFAQEDGIGGMNILDERYATGESSYDVTIDEALKMPYPAPDITYIDSSAAMLRGALTIRGIPNTGATHPIIEGIRNLRRMILDGNGMVLFRVHPRCVNLIRELQTYQYEETAQVAGDRKPLKQDDHGPDACRYLTYHLRFGA